MEDAIIPLTALEMLRLCEPRSRMEGKLMQCLSFIEILTWIQEFAFGSIKGRSQLSELIDDCMRGKLKVDKLITHRKTLDEISAGFDLCSRVTVFVVLLT